MTTQKVVDGDRKVVDCSENPSNGEIQAVENILEVDHLDCVEIKVRIRGTWEFILLLWLFERNLDEGWYMVTRKLERSSMVGPDFACEKPLFLHWKKAVNVQIYIWEWKSVGNAFWQEISTYAKGLVIVSGDSVIEVYNWVFSRGGWGKPNAISSIQRVLLLKDVQTNYFLPL